MSAAPILLLRRAVIAHLKADSNVTDKVAADNIFGERQPAEPTWPYCRYGISDALPGHEINFPIHSFSKGDFSDECAEIVERIGTSLDSISLALSDSRKANLILTRSSVQADPEIAGAWHGIDRIRATIIRDCDEQ